MLNLLGAVALLLWGLRMVRTGVSRAFGASLRHWIGLGTRNRFSAFLAGVGATLVLQSSTATALMTASFAARGLMTTAMAIAVMLGADVGTALVAQILSLDIHWLSPALILVGVGLFMSGEANRRRAIARALLGLGLMLLALSLLSEATAPIRGSIVVRNLLAALENAPILAVLITAALTAVAHSSLAIVLLIVSLLTTGAIEPPLALALVLGANLGGTIPPLLATASYGPTARRVPLGNMAVRLAGCILALPFVALIASWLMAWGSDPTRIAIDFHLAFNVVLALAFLPFVVPLAKTAERVIKAPPAPDRGPRYLDPSSLDTPSVALACAARETLRVGDLIEQMLVRSLTALRDDDPKVQEEIERMDDQVDDLHESIKLYVAQLGREGLDEADSRRATEIISFAINLEHIGDIIDKNLMELAGKKTKNRLRFSEEGFREITALHGRTVENLRIALGIFMSRDVKLARRLVTTKIEIRSLERASAESHFERLRQGRLETLQTSTLHLDVLRDLKRINAHITSVAYPILDEAGELRESRLRTVRSPSLAEAQPPAE